MAVKIDYVPRGAYCTYSGNTGLHEVLTAVEVLASDPVIDELKYVIHDCSGALQITLMDDALTEISAQSMGIAFSNTQLKGAIVTQDAQILRAVARYSEMTGRKVESFSTLHDAKAWAAGL
jgi:hypothetical protein